MLNDHHWKDNIYKNIHIPGWHKCGPLNVNCASLYPFNLTLWTIWIRMCYCTNYDIWLLCLWVSAQQKILWLDRVQSLTEICISASIQYSVWKTYLIQFCISWRLHRDELFCGNPTMKSARIIKNSVLNLVGTTMILNNKQETAETQYYESWPLCNSEEESNM